MKSVLLRLSTYITNKWRISFLLFLVSAIFGLAIGLSACYISAESLYMDVINNLYPAKLWLILKDATTNIDVDFDIQTFVNLNSEVTQVTVDNLDYKEIILASHDATQITLNEFNSMLPEDSPFVFVDATEFEFKQLIQTLEIQSKLQNAIIIGAVLCTALFFILINIVSMREFNNDAYILLRLGETKRNIALQYTLFHILVAIIPFFIIVLISLNFSGFVSNFWINTLVVDNSVVNFDVQRETLNNLENAEIWLHSKALLTYCLAFSLIVVICNYLYYALNKKL